MRRFLTGAARRLRNSAFLGQGTQSAGGPDSEHRPADRPVQSGSGLFALAAMPSAVLAQVNAEVSPDRLDLRSELAHPLLLAVVFTIIGLSLFAACLWIIVKVAPFSIRKEVEEDQNIALGIIIGSMILGIAIILAAAMIG